MAKDSVPPGKRRKISGLVSVGPLPYLISLPERSVRSTGALAGGLARELSEVVLPSSFRKTKLYRSLVDVTLRFVAEQVGQVQRASDLAPSLPSDFALRRSAGNGIEMAGILLFRFSPVWVLAALSDLSSTGRVLVREISASLVEKGLLERDVDFATIDELLNGPGLHLVSQSPPGFGASGQACVDALAPPLGVFRPARRRAKLAEPLRQERRDLSHLAEPRERDELGQVDLDAVGLVAREELLEH